jgi:hypothetical protein
MISEQGHSSRQHRVVNSGSVGITFLLLLLAGAGYLCIRSTVTCIDGCGPYHNPTSVADMDGDGDLDVLLSGLRHETETTFWAGSILWTNQGRGRFTSEAVDYGGAYASTGDLDGDGDPDVARLDYRATLYLNQGGEQSGLPGSFRQWRSLSPLQDAHNWSTPGSVVLGDLNNDGRLDALISYCCSMLIEARSGLLPFLPWVWINGDDSRNLESLGDLPMRPALGDLDGDGDLDVYAAVLPPRGAGYDAADRVLLNDGSGGLLDSGQRLVNRRLAGAAGSGAVALGDLDGDGDLDALVATAGGAAVWINQGGAQRGQAGVFAETGQSLGRGHVEAVFLGDMDSDGDLDPLVAGKARASVWWNQARADFRYSGMRLRYTERHGLAVGDFDGDGDLDVFSGEGDLEFRLWRNQGDGRLEEGG